MGRAWSTHLIVEIVVVRIVFPAAALTTLIVAIEAARSLRRSRLGLTGTDADTTSRKSNCVVSSIALCFEALSMVVLAIYCAFGSVGGGTIPNAFSLGASPLTFGFSIFTSLLVAILMNEEIRAAQGAEARNNFRCIGGIVALIAVLCLSCDVFFALTSMGYFEPQKTALSLLLCGFVVLGQSCTGFIFLKQACVLQKKDREHLRPPGTLPRTKNEDKIVRFKGWLKIMAFTCVGSAVVIGASHTRLRDYTDSGNLATFTFALLVLCRIGISYAHVQVLKPPEVTLCALIYGCKRQTQQVRETQLTPAPLNTMLPRKVRVLRQQQQRLLLLQHSSQCQYAMGTCPVSPFCAGVKETWEHVVSCKDVKCSVPHCMSTRLISFHHHNCNDKDCEICQPTRDFRYQEERFALMSQTPDNEQKLATVLRSFGDTTPQRRDLDPAMIMT